MTQLPEVFVGALAPASLYALLGVGFVLIYRASRAINFLQGNFVYIGALVFVSILARVDSTVASFILSVVGGTLAGGAIYLVAIRPVARQGVLIVVIVTLIIGTSILTGLTNITFGLAPRFFAAPLPSHALSLPGNAHITAAELVTIGAAIGFIGALAVILRYSRFGLRMRAGAENPTLARLRGVNVDVTSCIAWCIGGGRLHAGGSGVLNAGTYRSDDGESGNLCISGHPDWRAG